MGKLVNARNGAIVAASAVAAAASAWDRTHRRVSGADLTEEHLRVVRLIDLRHEKECLATIEGKLLEEWGEFALLGFDSIDEMAAWAGKTIFVVIERDAEGIKARGIVQTILTDVHGDAKLLEAAYPTFASLTSRQSWKTSRGSGGDTAVLLQITTLGPAERGVGLGSLLRNAVLNMLPPGVKYALTTTPVDGAAAESIDLEDSATYTPAMRFHQRGGAQPVHLLRGYKTPRPGWSESGHGRDVIVMRYARGASGSWPAKRPEMRVRRVGPFEERLVRTGRSLRLRGLKPARRLRDFRPHRPALPMVRPQGVLSGLKSGASRLTRRPAPPSTLEPPAA